MITVVQNFICTIPERLDLIRRNTPLIAKVWGDYEFIINYNWEDNFEEVYSIYKENIPKLTFYQNLEPDWGLVTRALLNEVKTPYVLFINEDQELFLTKQDWKNIVDEALVKHDVDYILMNKIEKYTKIGNLSVSDELFKFINEELLPNTKLNQKDFWENFDHCVHELAPENRKLIKAREKMQMDIVNEISSMFTNLKLEGPFKYEHSADVSGKSSTTHYEWRFDKANIEVVCYDFVKPMKYPDGLNGEPIIHEINDPSDDFIVPAGKKLCIFI